MSLATIRAEKVMTKRTVSELNPGDTISILNAWFRVRYMNYRPTETTVQLQREEDELSPFCDSTCLWVTVSNDTIAWFDVEVKNG